MLVCVMLCLSVTTFIVAVRQDTQTVMCSEIGEMHIADVVRDLLAFIGTIAET